MIESLTQYVLDIWNWVPLWGQNLAYNLALIVIILVPLLLCVAYLTFAERKLIGYMQLRVGPNRVWLHGWSQPIIDAIKLMTKEILVPTNANTYLFIIAPVLAIAPALAAWAVIPFGDDMVLSGIDASLLYVLALTSVGVYGMLLPAGHPTPNMPLSAPCVLLLKSLLTKLPWVLRW